MNAYAEQFAVADLDADGTPEVVLLTNQHIHSEPILILRWQDGQIYGYSEVGRGMQGLKADGVSWWSTVPSTTAPAGTNTSPAKTAPTGGRRSGSWNLWPTPAAQRNTTSAARRSPGRSTRPPTPKWRPSRTPAGTPSTRTSFPPSLPQRHKTAGQIVPSSVTACGGATFS